MIHKAYKTIIFNTHLDELGNEQDRLSANLAAVFAQYICTLYQQYADVSE